MNNPKIPETDSIQELAQFWDTHDLTDFEDELEEVRDPMNEPSAPPNINGTFPHLAVKAAHLPHRTEWFGKTDDLWHFGGKPGGWGGPWWETAVEPGQPSDPYLMTGFDQKCLHISQADEQLGRFTVELDFQGAGVWHHYADIETRRGYACHAFPPGLTAHWVRLIPHQSCMATAQFFYS